jgi:hypothetical protein
MKRIQLIIRIPSSKHYPFMPNESFAGKAFEITIQVFLTAKLIAMTARISFAD